MIQITSMTVGILLSSTMVTCGQTLDVIDAFRKNAEIRQKYGVITLLWKGTQVTGPYGVHFSVKGKAVLVHDYKSDGNRARTDVSIAHLSGAAVQHAFPIPRRPGVWSVTKQRITESLPLRNPQNIQLFIIRNKDDTVRVVDVENGTTFLLRIGDSIGDEVQ